MKLKTVLILSSLCLLITCILLVRYIDSQTYNACNIIDVNDLYKNIENDLGNMGISKVEEKYGCEIILREDEGYSNELFAAIKDSDIIVDYLKEDNLIGKVIIPANSSSYLQLKRNLSIAIGVAFTVILVLLFLIIIFIYKKILYPFNRLKHFAENISSGNFDIPLMMDRENYFGAFTESFDTMREELKRAKQGEYEANISKKELVAELSHDIKTPVSTIKALCELLELKVKDEDTLTKVHTINQKADIIDKLISNMFHATLEELEVLKIEPCEEFSTIIPPMFEELNHYKKIYIKNELPECLIYCDRLRLNQVIDNVINNSYKYADTAIDVTYYENEDSIEIKIRDYGSSVSNGDLPLVYEKFFRGENAATHSGTGLGLYLAKQFIEGMKGSIECKSDNGFVVKLTIKKV